MLIAPTYNFLHKEPRAPDTHRPTGEEEPGAEQEHVAKVEGYLQQARHLRLVEKVKHGVQEHVYGCAARSEEGVPLPLVVLCSQDEVDRND